MGEAGLRLSNPGTEAVSLQSDGGAHALHHLIRQFIGALGAAGKDVIDVSSDNRRV